MRAMPAGWASANAHASFSLGASFSSGESSAGAGFGFAGRGDQTAINVALRAALDADNAPVTAAALRRECATR